MLWASALEPFLALLPLRPLLVTLVLVSAFPLIRMPSILNVPSILAAAVLFGVLGGALCNFATQLKFVLGYDDALDVRLFRVLTKGSKSHTFVDLRHSRCRWYRW